MLAEKKSSSTAILDSLATRDSQQPEPTMAGPKKNAAKGQAKIANTKIKRLEKRAQGLADLEQLQKAVSELVRHNPQPPSPIR